MRERSVLLGLMVSFGLIPSLGFAQEPLVITYLTETPAGAKEVKVLEQATAEYAKSHPGAVLQIEHIAQNMLNQKIQLYASQDALPTLFACGTSPAIAKSLAQAGQLLDVEATFSELGLADQFTSTGVSLIKRVYGTPMVGIPKEANIDGFWYNKKIFADNGIAIPKTWDELLAAADKLHSKGVQVFTAPGASTDGWPITRMLGSILQRQLGPEAMDNVVSGKAKLTDPAYVAAAQLVADLGRKGYYEKGVGSTDFVTSLNTFGAGNAAMYYMGSWILSDFNNPKVDTLGIDNIGFFPVPAFPNGKGNDLTFMEPGETICFSKKAYTPQVGDWMKAVFSNFGDQMLDVSGVISGFVISHPPAKMQELSQTVLDVGKAATHPATWFDVGFPAEAATVASQNAGLLLTGQLPAQSYMEQVQAAIDKARS